mmetsp:Transcript_4653/g.6586  ORF Transcript_4653/g.6586 Transcript_4653/m.6586 type:complete len:198 (-) Transcript_4653:214-807(-)
MSGSTGFDVASDGKMSVDLQHLDQLGESQIDYLVQMTFTTLTTGRLPEEQVSEFASEHKIKPKLLKETLKGLLFFLSESLRKNMSGDAVKNELVKFGVDAGKSERIGTLWKTTFTKLAQLMKQKTLKVNELVDLQWKFGVTAATDSLQQVNTCFLQLKLTINKGNETEDVLMEMTLPQFYKFLQQMEQAQRQCESYT